MTEAQNNYKLTEEFIKKLFDLSAGYLPADKFDQLLELFNDEISKSSFSFSAESNLLRIITNMYDKISFMTECLQYPHYVELIISLSANSNYLTDILVVNPEFFYWIVNPSTLTTKLDKARFSEDLKNSLNQYKSLKAKTSALRTIKRKEILRIGTKDILELAGLEEVTRELSLLADTITSELFKLCYDEILAKYGLDKIKRKYCLVSLGKLGGNELNYSSDIDLIVFYDKNSKVTPNKSYNEILTEAVYLFIECSSSITSRGFLYRVDFRLRPDGRNSALCRSIDEYLNYYEIRGEDWERQMLIKAGFVCGSKSLYDKFINYLQPFIYPLSFSNSPKEQIKKLKSNIEKNLKDEEDIKLLPGGIRDIEFSVQALQLLNGGKNRKLKGGNTLTAINDLKKAGLLSEDEALVFDSAYRLYRKIEHYLQLMNDSQTHTIPQDGEILEKMSSFLHFGDSVEFKKEVTENRNSVQKIFNSIMGTDTGENESADLISYINFENKTRAARDLQFLREGKGLLGQKQFDKKSIEDFALIEPALEEFLNRTPDPDLVLQNFVRVLRPVIIPSIWYKEFRDLKFFESFLTICGFSQKSIDLFAEDEDLKEYFLTRKVFEKFSKNSFSSFSSKRFIFAAAVQFSLGMITAEKVSSLLSSFFRFKIKLISENYISNMLPSLKYTVAAMGSFGAGEMTFSSDIDLVFIAEDMEQYPDIQSAFQNLFLEVKKEMNPIEVDCRLRPEGKSSILVWDLKSYQTYVKNRARVWELQAFCKLDYIAGDKKIVNRLVRTIQNRIRKEAVSNLSREIIDMRKRLAPGGSSNFPKFFNIKKSSGGLADIDFLVQYLILKSNKYSVLRAKGIRKSVDYLAGNVREYSELKILNGNYSFLKSLDITNQTVHNSSSSVLPSDDKKIIPLVIKLGFENSESLQQKLYEVVKTNRLFFEKLLGQ